MRWNCEYWTEDCFVSTKQSKGRSKKPRLFQIIPSMKENITYWIRDHQDEMSVDAIHKAVHESLLQDWYDQYRTEQLVEFGDYYSLQQVLEFYGLTTVCEYTI